MNKKKIIAIIVIILVLILVVTGAILLVNHNNNLEKKSTIEKKNTIEAITEKDIIKNESVNGLEFSNTTLIKENGQYTMQMDVTNPSNEEIDLEEVNIIFKDKDNNEIVSLLGYIGTPMKVNETRTVTSYTRNDLSKAKSKTIEIKK